MRKFFLSERNLVIILFVMVFVIFSFAHEDTKRIEKKQHDLDFPATTSLTQSENDETILKDPGTRPPASHVQLR